MDAVARARTKPKGVVAFDVDGVLLRQQFLWRAALSAGLLTFIRTAWLGFLFKSHRLTVRQAVERLYALHAGRKLEEFLRVADMIPLARGAADTAHQLERWGYLVILLSAGVPQAVVERLCGRLGLDEGYGALLEEKAGVLTGRVLGDRHSAGGKRATLSSVLDREGLTWRDATVVVDDRSNTEIVRAAAHSIGVNPELPVLREAEFLLQRNGLRGVLEFFPDSPGAGSAVARHALEHELTRKAIHAAAVFVPVFAHWSKSFTLALVGCVTGLYVLSEIVRRIGSTLPVFTTLTRLAMRASESRGIVKGPILFGVGIWMTLALFGQMPATAGILTFAIGDGAASLVGSSVGRVPLPHSPGKTVEGSLAIFVVGALIAAVFISWPWALAAGFVASMVESLPIGDFDNLLLPMASASVVVFATSVS